VTVLKVVAAFLIGGMAVTAQAFGGPMADETPAADVASKQADSSDAAAQKAGIPLADRLPPGFKVKKRGKYTLYCKTDTPLGTRFKSETCYDENNMRAYMLALQENKSDVDRIRQTCSNPCACGMPEAC
jgi:hypothetical protein